MLLSACLRGLLLVPFILGSSVILPGMLEGSALSPVMSMFIAEMSSWMYAIAIVGALLVVVASFVGDYGVIVAKAEKKPETLTDHLLLAAEHDSAIAFATGVIRRLDETIATAWPSRKK